MQLGGGHENSLGKDNKAENQLEAIKTKITRNLSYFFLSQFASVSLTGRLQQRMKKLLPNEVKTRRTTEKM